jgi:hypothetical protein
MIGIPLGVAADLRPLAAEHDLRGDALGLAVAVEDSVAGECAPGRKGALEAMD